MSAAQCTRFVEINGIGGTTRQTEPSEFDGDTNLWRCSSDGPERLTAAGAFARRECREAADVGSVVATESHIDPVAPLPAFESAPAMRATAGVGV